MAARGWGRGPLSDDPALSGDPPRATIKVASTEAWVH